MRVLGIDPGLKGAFILFDGRKIVYEKMPLEVGGKKEQVSFQGVLKLLETLKTKYKIDHVYLERAMALAMGSSHAFNYGRGFAALEIAITFANLPVTQVLPQAWMKVMHDGVSRDLNPKARSLVALRRLFGENVDLPKNRNGVYLDGPVDALLIAAYGLKKLKRGE